MRCINLMTLYQPQPCVDNLKPYMMFREVKNRPDNRLTRTLGNVNFTDLWLEQIDASCGNHRGYVAQHFSLLCDKEEADELKTFWLNGCGQKILVSLIKVQSGIAGQTLKSVTEKIRDKAKGSRVFRTLDNADLIVIYFSKTQEELEQMRKELQYLETVNYYSFYSVEGEFSSIKLVGKECYRASGLNFPSDSLLLKDPLEEQEWCSQMIQELHSRIRACVDEKNKKWISYYHAIVQIVNLLGQYEQEQKFKDLFYVFFPPLQLFISQLDAGKALAESYDKAGKLEEKYEVIQKIEITVSDFIDAMENLLHHTGISCLNILNADGRNGLAYDISIRMCQMYLAVLHEVAESLNDTAFVYRFFLSPLTYSRPKTRIFTFGLEPANRLIRIDLARHQFYSPRSLICISAHEVGHYVGHEARLRKERAEMYLNIAVSCLMELLLPEQKLNDILDATSLSPKMREVFQADWNQRKEALWRFFQERLGMDLKAGNKNRGAFKYYIDEVYLDICESIKRNLYEVNAGPEIFFNEVYSELKKNLNNKSEYNDLLQAMHKECVLFRDNLYAVVISDELFDMLEHVKNALKEIYADCGAVLLLDMEPADYLESYLLSEGSIPDEDVLNDMVIHRIALVHYLMSENKTDWKKNWDSISASTWGNDFLYRLKCSVDEYEREYLNCIRSERNASEGSLARLGKSTEEQIFELYGTVPDEYLKESVPDHKFNPFSDATLITLELGYLKKACDLLKKKIGSLKSQNHVEKLRKLYSHFKVREENKESTYDSFFADMEEIIDAYRRSVVKEWTEWKNKP